MDLPLRLPVDFPSYGAVRLRPTGPDDVAMLVELSADPYVPLTGTLPADTDEAGARGYLDRQQDRLTTGAGYPFTVTLAETGEPVGTAGLWLASVAAGRATGGYAIVPRHRGRGLAAQALRALTAFAWTVPEVHRVELYVEPWNVASTRTARAAGYVREGLLRSHQEIGGVRVDMELFAAVRPRPASRVVS